MKRLVSEAERKVEIGIFYVSRLKRKEQGWGVEGASDGEGRSRIVV